MESQYYTCFYVYSTIDVLTLCIKSFSLLFFSYKLSEQCWWNRELQLHCVCCECDNKEVIKCKVRRRSKQNRPVLCNWTWGWRTASSSFRCRHSSSSYSAIVLSNSSNISSAAAVSRCFIKTLSVWTLDIFTDSHKLFLQKHSVKNCLLTLMCAVFTVRSAPSISCKLASFFGLVGHQEIIQMFDMFR